MTAKTTYTLLGAGGTGSILFDPLLRYLDTYHSKDGFNLQVIDGDGIEKHNLARQLFDEPAIGSNKASSLVEHSRYEPSHGRVFARPTFLGKDNVEKLIANGDIILIAVDNYSVRALVESRVKNLDNGVVINGGNESTDGSCQLWVRRDGANVTPPISHCHPEIAYKSADDRAALSCEARAKIKGGEQTIVANMASALSMLNMLRLHHQNDVPKGGHEVYFDLDTQAMRPDDLRGVEGWN